MTTIAFRDGVLAADSQVTCGAVRDGTAKKIGRTPDGRLWAFTGKLRFMEAWREWCEAPAGSTGPDAPRLPEIDDSTGILISPDGVVREWWGDGWVVNNSSPVAWGSGSELALGAMAAGASAEEAVAIAIRLHIESSGPINIEHLVDG